MAFKIPTGIVERINSASTKKEVEGLVNELRAFTFVSEKTFRRAMRAAKQRVNNLSKSPLLNA